MSEWGGMKQAWKTGEDDDGEDDRQWAQEEFFRWVGAYVCIGWHQGERLRSRWSFLCQRTNCPDGGMVPS